MTIHEVLTLIELKDKKAKEDLENKANVIRIAISSAMSGKPVKIFEDEPKVKKGNLKHRAEEFKALDDLGL